jgi:hypothetical protein
MWSLYPRLTRLGLGILAVAVIGCGSDPIAPTDAGDLLASTFDALARQSNQQGDADASLVYGYTAMALRLGVRPTPLSVTIDDEPEIYQALVHVVRHGAGANDIALRTLVAFRQDTPASPPTEVLYLALAVDSARVAHPATASPVPIAWSIFRDYDKRQVWVATGGKAGIRETVIGGPCTGGRKSMNATCTTATFSVFLDGDFQLGIARTQVAAEPIRGMRFRVEAIPGADLMFEN